jgi:NADPH2:quinone reductase
VRLHVRVSDALGSQPRSAAPQLEKLGLTPSLAFLCYETDKTLTQVVPAMRAWGKIGSIVGTPQPIDFTLGAFHKALSFHYELMFARGLSGHDLEAQGRILNDAARLIDEGALQSLVTKREVLSLKTLREAHRQSESWTSIGKTTFTIPDKWE